MTDGQAAALERELTETDLLTLEVAELCDEAMGELDIGTPRQSPRDPPPLRAGGSGARRMIERDRGPRVAHRDGSSITEVIERDQCLARGHGDRSIIFSDPAPPPPHR